MQTQLRSERTAPVLDIQRFCLHDGPGIRTVVFLKGCPLRCRWCQNPESQERLPTIGFYANRCRAFLECRDACRHGAVRAQGHRIDYSLCTGCGECVDACPTGALEKLGRTMSVSEVLDVVRADADYTTVTGGGLTVSGGEPLLYPLFMAELLRRAASVGLPGLIETCGHFAFEQAQSALESASMIYFDLKLMESQAHRDWTGADNALILSNARTLMRRNLPVEFRIPLVPGITDTEANLLAACAFISDLGLSEVHLLGYHNLGESKIAVIDGPQPRLGLPTITDAQMQHARRIVQESGLSVVGREDRPS